MKEHAAAARRAAELVRWYPAIWRARYGEEFVELLSDEIAEQPISWQRDLDVRLHGIKARLAVAGLGQGIAPDPRAATTAAVIAFSTFLAATSSLAAQMSRVSPFQAGTHPAVFALRLTLAITFGAIALLGLARMGSVMRRAASTIRRSGVRELVVPVLITGIGGTILAAGFAATWSVVGYRPTAATVSEVATMAISTAWVHPHALLSLLFEQPAVGMWMVLSPLALGLIVTGVSRLAGALGRESSASTAGWRALLLAPAFAASAWWVVGSQHSQDPMLRAGTLDLALLAGMAMSLLILTSVGRRTSAPTP